MDIKSMTLEEVKDICQQMGEKPFRAKQLYDWMHHRLAGSYDEMTNLSLAFREKLKEQYPLTCLEKVQVQESKIDGTRKYLFRLSDGNVIESVWMKYHHGNSVCISSQVGCRMGCRFCASTIGGLVRCLTPSEMLDQIYRIWEDTGSGSPIWLSWERVSRWTTTTLWCASCGCFRARKDSTSARETSPFPPAESCRICTNWQMRDSRSPWHFPSMHQTMRSAAS